MKKQKNIAAERNQRKENPQNFKSTQKAKDSGKGTIFRVPRKLNQSRMKNDRIETPHKLTCS